MRVCLKCKLGLKVWLGFFRRREGDNTSPAWLPPMLNPFDQCGFLKTFDDFSGEITINNHLPLQQKLLQVDSALLGEPDLQSSCQQFITYAEGYIQLGFVW